MQRRHCLTLFALALPLQLHASLPRLRSPAAAIGDEPVLVPCEGCEAAFDGLPADAGATSRIAPKGEPGEPLTLSGVVRDASGMPRSGIVIYAYHTDAGGRYPDDPRLSGAAARHGRLRAWAITDAAGNYSFRTIRPGSYPGESMPQHIHMHVIEPGRGTYYLGDTLFDDDPLLTPRHRAEQTRAHGGNGIVRVQGDAVAGWSAHRDIVLGANVPGYA